MNIVIKNGHIIDPSQGIDGIGDVVIENGKTIEIKMQDAGCRMQDKKKEKSGIMYRAS